MHRDTLTQETNPCMPSLTSKQFRNAEKGRTDESAFAKYKQKDFSIGTKHLLSSSDLDVEETSKPPYSAAQLAASEGTLAGKGK